MSSDSLLESRAPPPTPRMRSGQKARQVNYALKHWWAVTTDRKFLSSAKSRLVWKVVTVLVVAITAYTDSDFFQADWDFSMLYTKYTFLFAGLISFTPHESLWLDFFVGAWGIVDDLAYAWVPPKAEFWWQMFWLLWTRVGGIHSLAALPQMWVPLACRHAFTSGVDALLPYPYRVTLTVVVMAVMFLTEWQGANSFYQRQKYTGITELLLDQATDGQCTLSFESGIVSNASRAFLQNLSVIEGTTTVFDLFSSGDQAKAASLMNVRGALLPSSAMSTFLRRPTQMGAPAVEFKAKLVPFAISEEGVHVCLHKVGEERILEALVERPRGDVVQATAFLEPARRIESSGSTFQEDIGHVPDCVSEHQLECNTEVSLNIAKALRPVPPTLKTSTTRTTSRRMRRGRARGGGARGPSGRGAAICMRRIAFGRMQKPCQTAHTSPLTALPTTSNRRRRSLPEALDTRRGSPPPPTAPSRSPSRVSATR